MIETLTNDGPLLHLDIGYLRNFTEGRRALNSIAQLVALLKKRDEEIARLSDTNAMQYGQLQQSRAELARLKDAAAEHLELSAEFELATPDDWYAAELERTKDRSPA